MHRFLIVGLRRHGYVAGMRKADRQAALASAFDAIANGADAKTLDDLAARMQSLAIVAQMQKRPQEARTALKVLAIAERRLTELRPNASVKATPQ